MLGGSTIIMEYYELEKDNDLGKACLSLDSLNTIATVSGLKVEGVYPAKKDSTMTDIKYKENNLDIVLNVKLLQSVNVARTCATLQKEVYTKILEMTGIKTNTINVNIVGFVSE